VTVSRWLVVAAVFVLLAACSVRRAYEGPPLPPSEVAIIESASSYYVVSAERMQIESIDGRSATWEREVEVAPGPHRITASYHSMVAGVQYIGVSVCFIQFNAIAGHRYRIDYESHDDRWRAFLTDATAAARVAPCEWRDSFHQSWTPIYSESPTPTPAR
jgi:hypothetical protein